MYDLALKLINECKATQSKFLDLGNCGLKELPKELFDCVWLEELSLGKYRYTDFSQGFSYKHQESSINWDIGESNRLESIPEAIGKLSKLTVLQMWDNLAIAKIPSLAALRQLKNLRVLVLKDCRLTNCLELKHLPQLKAVSLENNNLSQLPELTRLTQLKHLNLSNNTLKDVSTLGALPQLETLVLSNNTSHSEIVFPASLPNVQRLELNDMTYKTGHGTLEGLHNYDFLVRMPQLKHVSMRSCYLFDESLMLPGELPALETLDVYDNCLKNLEFLSLCPRLKHLKVSHNYMGHLEITTHLTELQSLDLSSNRLTWLQFMADFPQLHTLHLHNNELTDASFILAMPCLRYLDISSNHISTLDLLEDMPHVPLQYLNMRFNAITHYSFLSGLTQLQSLELGGSNLTNPDFLKSLPQLQSLSLNYSETKDLKWIEGLTHLQKLKLGNNQIDSLSGLSSLVHLQYLELQENKLTSLEELATLKNLEHLQLQKNQITSLKGLEVLEKLQIIVLDNNKITNAEALKALPELTHVGLENNPVDVLPLWQAINERNLVVSWGYCNISDYPESAQANELIAACKKNKNTTLDLGQCGLARLPEALYECTWLEELNLSNVASANKGVSNRLVAIPEKLESLTLLEKLNLSGCLCPKISENAEGLKYLDSLKELDLSYNDLRNRSFLLNHIFELRRLNLSYSNLTELNFHFLPTENMEELDVCGNPIQELSDDNWLVYIAHIKFSEELVSPVVSRNFGCIMANADDSYYDNYYAPEPKTLPLSKPTVSAKKKRAGWWKWLIPMVLAVIFIIMGFIFNNRKAGMFLLCVYIAIVPIIMFGSDI